MKNFPSYILILLFALFGCAPPESTDEQSTMQNRPDDLPPQEPNNSPPQEPASDNEQGLGLAKIQTFRIQYKNNSDTVTEKWEGNVHYKYEFGLKKSTYDEDGRIVISEINSERTVHRYEGNGSANIRSTYTKEFTTSGASPEYLSSQWIGDEKHTYDPEASTPAPILIETYDQRGRLIREEWDDGTELEYRYVGNGTAKWNNFTEQYLTDLTSAYENSEYLSIRWDGNIQYSYEYADDPNPEKVTYDEKGRKIEVEIYGEVTTYQYQD